MPEDGNKPPIDFKGKHIDIKFALGYWPIVALTYRSIWIRLAHRGINIEGGTGHEFGLCFAGVDVFSVGLDSTVVPATARKLLGLWMMVGILVIETYLRRSF